MFFLIKKTRKLLKNSTFQYIISQVRKEIFEKTKEEKNMATRDKNIWILIVFILSGLVIGGLIGQLASRVDALWWLAYGESFGLSEPLQLDLSVVKLTFSLMLKINISSIVGMAIAIFIYRKV